MATRSSEKKTVLVTGSEGFIGKNLIAQLELSDAFIIKGLNRSNSSDVKELCRDVDFVFISLERIAQITPKSLNA